MNSLDFLKCLAKHREYQSTWTNCVPIGSTSTLINCSGSPITIGNGVEEGDLSKLLGTPFGLNLNTLNVDQFLYNEILQEA